MRKAKKQRNLLIFTLILCVTLSVLSTAASTISSIYKFAKNSDEEQSEIIATSIHTAIRLELEKSISALRIIAANAELKNILSNKDLSEQALNQAKAYTKNFISSLEQRSFYMILHASKQFYASDGESGELDEKKELWYDAFIKSKNDTRFLVDYDKSGIWTLFGALKVYDESGTLLGVVGLGIDMEYIAGLLSDLEARHDSKIALVDDADFVMLGSLQNYEKSMINDEITELGWRLMVLRDGDTKEFVTKLIINDIIITGFVLLVAILLVWSTTSKSQKRLINLSELDGLTSINNRASGEEKIKELLKKGKSGVLCLLDADKFKSINDTYGHAAGDKVIIAVANALASTFRSSDVVLRLGGDEFCAFGLGINDESTANALFERFFAKIDEISLPELKGRKISVSLGASFASEQKNFDKLFGLADWALYESKKTAGNKATIA